MDNSHNLHQQDGPIHLANLVSTEPGLNPANNNNTNNKIQSVDSYSYDPSSEKNLDLNNDKQFLQPQPQQQQQQQQQYPIQPSLEITNASNDALNMTMSEKDMPSYGTSIIQPPATVAAPRMKLANVVDKVRVAKILQNSQTDILAAEASGREGGTNSSLLLSPLSTNTHDSRTESGHGN
jgi:hypothetical protein